MSIFLRNDRSSSVPHIVRKKVKSLNFSFPLLLPTFIPVSPFVENRKEEEGGCRGVYHEVANSIGKGGREGRKDFKRREI